LDERVNKQFRELKCQKLTDQIAASNY
jgi:hypothetical protein